MRSSPRISAVVEAVGSGHERDGARALGVEIGAAEDPHLVAAREGLDVRLADLPAADQPDAERVCAHVVPPLPGSATR